MQQIKPFLKAIGLSLLLTSCIGENPNDGTSSTTTTTTTPSTPTASTTKTPVKLEPGLPGVEPAIYGVRTASEDILKHYMHDYAKNNKTLDKRDEHATTKNIAKIFEGLTKWSDAATHWSDQHGNKLETPPDNSHVRIVYDGGGSVIATDGAHVIQRLQLDKESGVFIADETSINMAYLTLNEQSWIDVRGRMGAARVEMSPESLIDLTNGYGFIINTDIADLTVDKNLAQTGILELKETGQAKIDGGIITLHKADIQGTLKARNATFNFQTRRDNSIENIGFMHTKGQIEVLKDASSSVPAVMMTINGPFKFGKDAEIKLLLDNASVSQIVLNYPFSVLGMPEADKPQLDGKFEFVPTVEELNTTTGNGILVLKSNVEFPALLDLSKSIVHDEILGKKLTLVAGDLSGDDPFKHAVYLKIDSIPTGLSRTIQETFQTFKEAQIYSLLASNALPPLFEVSKIKGRLTCFQYANGTHSSATQLTNFGLNIEHALRNSTLVWKHAFTRTQYYNDLYKLLPNAHTPFWEMHSYIGLRPQLNLFNMLTVDGGVSYLCVPKTLFQESFHGFFPEVSTHLTLSKHAHLSANVVSTTVYDAYRNEWLVNWGAESSVKLNNMTFSSLLLNPFSSAMQLKINLELSF